MTVFAWNLIIGWKVAPTQFARLTCPGFPQGECHQDTVGHPELAPDLAVEIKSPSNTYAELADKAAMWLRYGSRQVWMADPGRVTATDIPTWR